MCLDTPNACYNWCASINNLLSLPMCVGLYHRGKKNQPTYCFLGCLFQGSYYSSRYSMWQELSSLSHFSHCQNVKFNVCWWAPQHAISLIEDPLSNEARFSHGGNVAFLHCNTPPCTFASDIHMQPFFSRSRVKSPLYWVTWPQCDIFFIFSRHSDNRLSGYHYDVV